jgi:RHS repeat-associated protein
LPGYQVVRRIDARGNRTSYVYNANGALTQRKYPDGSRATFSYDAVGNRTMMANATGRYTTVYNVLQQAARVVQPGNQIVTYNYDQVGNLSRMRDMDDGRFTYTWNANDQIATLINPQAQRTTYAYDAAGRRTVKKMANGTRASFTYDNANQLTTLANMKPDGSMISKYVYTYDAAGNKTRVVEADGSIVTWSYDATYQLTGEHRTSGSSEESWATLSADDWDALTADEWSELPAGPGYQAVYSYDAAGNRLLKTLDGLRTTYAYDAANQLRYSQDSAGRTTYTFDADGNQQVQWEPSGNRTTYVWDYENRMSAELQPAATRSTMSYDPDGLRVLLQDSSGTKKFIWDHQNYLAELDAMDATQVVYTNEPRRYGRLISQRRGSTTSWFHFDAIGSTRQLTDSGSIVTDARLYDAWGVQMAASGTTVFSFGYIGVDGYYTNHLRSLIHVRARHLKSQIGVWLSVDPIWQQTSVLSYAYVENQPTKLNDPSGLANDLEVVAGRARELGLPQGIANNLLLYGDTGLSRGPGHYYSVFWNTIYLPDGQFPNNYWRPRDPVRCRALGPQPNIRPDLDCLKFAHIYNEMWHAWWDQVLEERQDCAWLYDLFLAEGRRLYGSAGNPDYVEMTEEAISETIDNYIGTLCAGATPTYGSTAQPPGHDGKGEKWEGNKLAQVKISPAMFRLALHAIEHGCRSASNHPGLS